MGAILNNYNKYGDTMLIGYIIKTSKIGTTQIRKLSIKQINVLIDNYNHMQTFQNNMNTILDSNVDDLLFILNDELFNRRIKRIV